MSSSPTETLVDVTMPQMGVSVAEGTVVEWKKQPGDWIERDEIICSISTDKIDTDVESPAAGRVSELVVAVGETVEVGVVLARIATDAKPGEPHVSENGAGTASGPVEGTTTEASSALGAPGAAGELQGDTDADHDDTVTERTPVPRRPGPRRYSPVVMRIAAEHGIDLSAVEGTGRGGRVRKQDVLAVVERGGEEPPMHIESPYQPDEPAPPKARRSRWVREEAPAPAPAVQGLSRMRQAIGRRMVESLRTAATCTTVIEVDMSRVEAERQRLGLTALPFVARATVQTLREFPALNATLDGDEYSRSDAVHLGIAVSLGEEGLIVPVIRDAQDLSTEGLAARIKDLARRARSNQLQPDEVRGGTFTITNPGGYGSILATPVINQPQVAILDTEATVKRPVVIDDAIAIRPMAYFCMSWDHRALDGAEAARFLAALRAKLEA